MIPCACNAGFNIKKYEDDCHFYDKIIATCKNKQCNIASIFDLPRRYKILKTSEFGKCNCHRLPEDWDYVLKIAKESLNV